MDTPDTLDRLQALLDRIQSLSAGQRQQADELRSLRQHQEQLLHERALLINRNEQARARVEAMITRLKALEQHT